MKNNKVKRYLETLNTRFSKTDLEQLDGWRGFLAFIVVIAHANQVFIDPIIGIENYINWSFGVIAHFAVLGFFVISGIAISMSLVINLNKNNGNLNFRQYIVARVSRIYPPLILSILLCVLFYSIIHSFDFLGATKSCKLIGDKYAAREFFTFSFNDVQDTFIFKNDSLVKVNGPLWSLIIEWWLYFLALFGTGIIFAKNKFIKLLSCIIFLLILKKVLKINGLIYIGIWSIGSCFYLFKNFFRHYIFCFVFSLMGLICCGSLFNFVDKMTDISTLPFVQVFASILFLSLIFKFPVKSIFNKTSKFSYTLYIIHFPFFLFVFSVFHKQTQNSIFQSIVLSLISILIIVYSALNFSTYFENKNTFSNKLNLFLNFLEKKALNFKIKKNV